MEYYPPNRWFCRFSVVILSHGILLAKLPAWSTNCNSDTPEIPLLTGSILKLPTLIMFRPFKAITGLINYGEVRALKAVLCVHIL